MKMLSITYNNESKFYILVKYKHFKFICKLQIDFRNLYSIVGL